MKAITKYQANDGSLFDDINDCHNYELSKEKPKTIWRLLRDIPGAKAGTIFVHDPNDSIKGSIGCGCLKLAWEDGNVQVSRCDYCGECIVFPGQLARESQWFTQVRNPIVTNNSSIRQGKVVYY